MLKRAALGRMMTVIKKLKSTLSYLEEVRKFLARMPSVDPYARTLLICGFPNAGKSSFMNTVTKANVDVQPYPFTTQSLFVGHTDHLNVRWQIIDSPGILDHPLEQRNTIEMQTVTALAHLKACVIWFIDISETGSYTIKTQIELYKSMRPVLAKKPHIIVLTKVDLKRFEELDQDDQDRLNALTKEEDVTLLQMSNHTGEGVFEVKDKACDILLQYRLDQNADKITGGSKVLKSEEGFMRGLTIAYPKKRDDVDRPPVIPQAILNGEKLKLNRPTLKEVEEQNGGAGVFNYPFEEHFILEDPDWKYDVVPEIMDGKNIFDFIDPEILNNLEKLEKEEEMLLKAEMDRMTDEFRVLDPEIEEAYRDIKSKRTLMKLEHKMNKRSTIKTRRAPVEVLKKDLEEKGFLDKIGNKVLKGRKGKPLERIAAEALDEMEIEDGKGRSSSKGKFDRKMRSVSRTRAVGYQKEMTPQEEDMDRLRAKIERSWRNLGRKGPGDRRVETDRPEHLFSGKRGIGKNDRR